MSDHDVRRRGRGLRAVLTVALTLPLATLVAAGLDHGGVTGTRLSSYERSIVISGVPRDGVGTDSAKVKAILARVHAVSHEVTAAEAKYSRALNAVAAGVDASISDDRNQGAVRSLLRASRHKLQLQVLGLYSSAGFVNAGAALLAPGGVSEYDENSQAMSTAIARTVATARQQRAVATAANARVSSSSQSAEHSIVYARSVSKVAAHVTVLLAEQHSLLAKARVALASAQKVATARAALAAETSTFSSDTSSGVTAVGILPPSAQYLALYKGAATTCPGLPWTVLAAIGQVESGHGRNDGPSSAGAEGPMQFEPSTFQAYAVDGDGDGVANINDPADSIYTAAHYLCANGAGRGGAAVAHAVFDYNHASWYVSLVVGLANKYAAAYS